MDSNIIYFLYAYILGVISYQFLQHWYSVNKTWIHNKQSQEQTCISVKSSKNYILLYKEAKR